MQSHGCFRILVWYMTYFIVLWLCLTDFTEPTHDWSLVFTDGITEPIELVSNPNSRKRCWTKG